MITPRIEHEVLSFEGWKKLSTATPLIIEESLALSALISVNLSTIQSTSLSTLNLKICKTLKPLN